MRKNVILILILIVVTIAVSIVLPRNFLANADDLPNASYIITFYTPTSTSPYVYYTNHWSFVGTSVTAIRLNGYTYYNDLTKTYEHSDRQLWLFGTFIVTER